jgi:Antitoxin Xre/MbcA/ParS C-terminal toxin-binding domain/Antitoxin Xre-like helix-turn-helix domain
MGTIQAARVKANRVGSQLAAAEQRRDPAVRRRLSEPALRTFFAISRAWGLSATEERALLGWPPSSTFHKYKSGNAGVLSFDTLTRISLVLGIYKALEVLYSDTSFADRWMSMPNANPMFEGQTPIAFVAEAGLDGLCQVRRLLDARRG